MPRPLPPPQPALAVMKMRRVQQRTFAEVSGYSPTYVSHVLNSRVPASAEFRRKLSAYLRLDERDLFRDDDVVAQAAELLERRVAQGLPLHVDDPAVLAQVAGVVRAAGS